MAEDKSKGKGKGDGGKDISKDPILSGLVNQYLEDLMEIYVENRAERSVILAAFEKAQVLIDKVLGSDIGQLLTTTGASLFTTAMQVGLIKAGMQPETAETVKESTDGLLDTIRRMHRERGNKLLPGDVGKATKENLALARTNKERLMSFVRARKMLPLPEREAFDAKLLVFRRMKKSNELRWNKWKLQIDNTEDLRALNHLDVEEEWEEHLTQTYGEVSVPAEKPAPATSSIASARAASDVLNKILTGQDKTVQDISMAVRVATVGIDQRTVRTKRIGRRIDAYYTNRR